MSDCGEVTETETVLHALLTTRLLLLGALWGMKGVLSQLIFKMTRQHSADTE